MEKPAGKLAWEDSRHRHERGTALKVDADPWLPWLPWLGLSFAREPWPQAKDQLLYAPELEVSGPAIYSKLGTCVDASSCRLEYVVLVAGRPERATWRESLVSLTCVPLGSFGHLLPTARLQGFRLQSCLATCSWQTKAKRGNTAGKSMEGKRLLPGTLKDSTAQFG